MPLVGHQDFERYAHGTGCQWPWMPVLTAAALVQEEALTVWWQDGRGVALGRQAVEAAAAGIVSAQDLSTHAELAQPERVAWVRCVPGP